MKKLLGALLALITLFGASFSAASCGDDACEHNVGTWDVVTPATCMKEGMQQGKCGICYETVSKTVPVDPENHAYGEWDIQKMPTETESGLAVKTCGENVTHLLGFTLPVLGDLQYESSITERPSPAKDGVRSYALAHETGAVQFTQPIPKTGIQTLRDAVDLGASTESAALIRRAEGEMGTQYFEASFDSLVATTYHATLSYPVETEVSVSFLSGTEKDGVRAFTATVTTGAGETAQSEKLACSYASASRTLVSEHNEGDELGFSLCLSKEFNLILSHPNGTGAEEEIQLNKEPQALLHAHSYECGENYIHIVDGTDNCERWYFTEGDELFGLTTWDQEEGVIGNDLVGNGNRNYLKGSRFYLQYANDLGYFFGVEGLLEGLYRAARWSANNDFTESVETNEDGEPVYTFSFGNVQNSGKKSGYFSKITVKFTLTESYTVEDIWVTSVIYVNNSEQGEGEIIKTWDVDEEGFAYVLEGMEYGTRYVSTIQMHQTMKADGDEIPVNQHTLDKIYVSDFDILYHDELLGEGDVAEFASGEYTDYVFAISNIQPQSALENYQFDDFTFYLKTEDGPVEINANTMVSAGMTAFMDETTKKFFLNARRAGEQTVIVKTKFVEKEIHCKISEDMPTALYPSIYSYSDGEYAWDDKTSASAIVQSYVNQPIYFTANVPAEEVNYASASHTAQVLNSKNEPAVDLLGNPVENRLLTPTFAGNRSVMQFTPDATGRYTIVLTSKLDTAITARIILIVSSAPSVKTLMEKEYEQQLQYPQKSEVTLTFENVQENTVVGTDGVTVYTLTATANITTIAGMEKLNCVYVVETTEKGVVNSREFTSEHSSGVNGGFILALNEGYDFTLSHLTGFDDGWETVVFWETVVEEV